MQGAAGGGCSRHAGPSRPAATGGAQNPPSCSQEDLHRCSCRVCRVASHWLCLPLHFQQRYFLCMGRLSPPDQSGVLAATRYSGQSGGRPANGGDGGSGERRRRRSHRQRPLASHALGAGPSRHICPSRRRSHHPHPPSKSINQVLFNQILASWCSSVLSAWVLSQLSQNVSLSKAPLLKAR